MEEAILEELINHAPLAVVVIGVIVFILGAAGGLPIGKKPLQIRESGWRIGLGCMGIILVGTGLLLLAYDYRDPSAAAVFSESVEQYGIKIISPRNSTLEGGQYLDVVGRYASRPPENSLWLFIVTPHDGRYWPKAIIQDFDDQGSWRGKIWIAGGNYPSRLVAVIVGKTSQSWLHYFNKVIAKQLSGAYLESPFPNDIRECDQVDLDIRTSSNE